MQQLRATGHREWQWAVTPLQSGSHPLWLTVSVHYEDTELERKTFQREITVHVGWGQAAWAWVTDNYAAIGGIVATLVALVTAASKWPRRPFRRKLRSVAGPPGSAERPAAIARSGAAGPDRSEVSGNDRAARSTPAP